MIIIGILYLSRPIFGMFNIWDKKEEEVEKSLSDQLENFNINVIYPTPEFENLGALNTVPQTMVVITPTPDYNMTDETVDFYTFGYSYYFPDLGGVNCHTDNWNIETEKCSDVTASGKSWKQNMYRGVAVHYDMLYDLPFGTLIEVIKPDEVKGWYEVIDICPGCTPRYEGQVYFIDFLDDKQRLGWGEEVIVKVKK
ncbi:MAG: hypothetical protein MUO40_13935 [Anaerolineaceae bacterium]|nr:hypothetical protein [Anaerolineaceae bacterium]